MGETNPVVLPGMVFTIEPGIYIAEEGIGIDVYKRPSRDNLCVPTVPAGA